MVEGQAELWSCFRPDMAALGDATNELKWQKVLQGVADYLLKVMVVCERISLLSVGLSLSLFLCLWLLVGRLDHAVLPVSERRSLPVGDRVKEKEEENEFKHKFLFFKLTVRVPKRCT